MRLVLSLALLVGSAFAQRAAVGYPPQGLSVSPGSNLTVQVERPNSQSSFEEVAVVIAIQSCPGAPCISPADYMGQILYNGPFNPQYYEKYTPPYENFTVQIPSSIATGTALLGVAHFNLIGAGRYPSLETLNCTITIS